MFRCERATIALNPFDLLQKKVSRISLEKPFLKLKVEDLFIIKPSQEPLPSFSLRALNIHDGKVILLLGERRDFQIPSIRVNATNLNLGDKTGISMNAYLPALSSTLTVRFRGSTEEKVADLQIREVANGALSRPFARTADSDAPVGTVKAQFKMTMRENRTIAIDASGESTSFKILRQKINGNFISRVDLDPRFQEAQISAGIQLSEIPSEILSMYADKKFPFGKGSVIASLQGRYRIPDKSLDVKALTLKTPFGSADGQGTVNLNDEPKTLSAQFRLHDVPLSFAKPFLPHPLNDFEYRGTAAAELSFSGSVNSPSVRGVAHSQEATVISKKDSLSRFSVRVPFEIADSAFQAKAARLTLRGIRLNQEGDLKAEVGAITIDGEVTRSKGGPIKTTGHFQLLGGRFASRDGSKGGEKIQATGNFHLINNANEARTSFQGKLDFQDGEVLWGKFFGELKSRRPKLELDGDFLPAKDEIRFRELSVTLGSIGTLHVRGSLRHALDEKAIIDLETQSDALSIGGLYDFFIRETYNTAYPFLDRLRTLGRSRFTLHVQGSTREFSARGRLEVKGGEIQVPADQWGIGPVEVDLPLDLYYPRAKGIETPRANQAGLLFIGGVKLGSTTIPAIETTLSLRDNTLRFLQPMTISVYGGSIIIKTLSWTDVIESPREISFALDLKDLQLLKLTEALDWYRFGGTITGSIPRAQWATNALRSQGEIELNLFGGRMVLKEMRMDNPFSRLPSIKLDARLEGIDLERASETFEFGRISGILEGDIEDLVVTDGQAAQFRADIHTVDRWGTGQWISVEALDKISVLSSGNEAGFLYHGIARFFENFRYSKLGFKAVLKNDRLTLQGIESREGKEYLVVGSLLPPTVNIISHTQQISFSELMRRLERVGKAGQPARPRK